MWTAASYNTHVSYFMTAAGVYEQLVLTAFPIVSNIITPINDQCILFIGNTPTRGACNFDKPAAYPLCDDLVINYKFVYYPPITDAFTELFYILAWS
jgi:hypothetical protein